MAESSGGGLQILSDERHQRHEWLLERTGFAAIGLILAAALAGLAGGGPLSRAVVRQGPLTLEYDRFVRTHGTERLVVEIAPESARDGRVRLWLDRAFAEGLEIEAMDVEPLAAEVEGGRLVWVFAAPAAPGNGRPLRLGLRFRPDFIGGRAGSVGLDGGPALSFRQFAFP